MAGLGGAAAWPVATLAQQPAMPVIGWLVGEPTSEHLVNTFRQALEQQSFVGRQNVEMLYRSAENQYDRLPELAADLVRRGVDVIVASGGAAPVVAAKSATATIPIVFASAADPVALDLVTSLNRPGGNITGVSILAEALVAKRLELLHETVPAAELIGYLVNPTSPQVEVQIKNAESSARVLGVRLVTLRASTPNDIEVAFAVVAERQIEALITAADPFFYGQRNQLAGAAARHAVPAIYQVREMVDVGGLMSYGPNLSEVYRMAGGYVGRILKGEKPANLPVQQATKVELVLNMKTAKPLGLTFPTALLVRADVVIE
jgi:putative tryptophan/tyrosine transport system substrate-binding protein